MKAIDTIKKLEEGYPLTIAALGDSLTYGWLVNKGYLDYFKEMILSKYAKCVKLNIINSGIPGDTASGGLTRLDNDVLKYNPDTIFVQFSLNDAFSGYSSADFGKNIQEIVDRIKRNTDAEIILITSIYLGFSREWDIPNRFYDILEKLADRNKVPVARVHKYWEDNIKDEAHFLRLVQGDQVHPNEDGYKMMAEAIMKIF